MSYKDPNEDRLIYLTVAFWLLIVIACSLWNEVKAEPTVEPVVKYDHDSDITRGVPFNDQEEYSSDYVAAGITVTAGRRKRWEIDITHGRRRIDRDIDSASEFEVRWYPRRRR